jgi:hypothetical protein
MAQEGIVSASIQVSKNGLSASFSFSTTFDLTGTEFGGNVRQATTTAGAIDFAGIDQNQCCLIANKDAANTLSIYLDSGATQLVSAIPPGKGIVLWGASLSMWAKSSAGTVDYIVVAAEN